MSAIIADPVTLVIGTLLVGGARAPQPVRYAQTPKAWLRGHPVTVRANGTSLPAQPIDWGPAASTGRVTDLSPGIFRPA